MGGTLKQKFLLFTTIKVEILCLTFPPEALFCSKLSKIRRSERTFLKNHLYEMPESPEFKIILRRPIPLKFFSKFEAKNSILARLHKYFIKFLSKCGSIWSHYHHLELFLYNAPNDHIIE